jgi:hypothetical protein
VLTTALALACMAYCVALASLLRKRGPFQPVIAIMAMAVIDVLVPAVYWVWFGQVNNPEWAKPLGAVQIEGALNFYVPFLVLLTLVAVAAQGMGRTQARWELIPVGELERRMLLLGWALVALTAVQIVLDVVEKGDLEAWFWSKFVFSAITGGAGSESEKAGGLSIVPSREVFQAIAGLGFAFRRRFKRATIFRKVFPVLAMGLAVLTFLRGSVLACLITFIFAEFYRRRFETDGSNIQPLRIRPILVAATAIVLSIYVYGSVRDDFRGAAASLDSEASDTEVKTPTFLTAGHGLLGVAHILDNYGNGVPYLMGKTYIDMLLLPIPRAIYTSKPDWYGIDDITRGMGWPESTQSAVTMPGEAYANFGLWGLVMAIPLGMLFGLTYRLSLMRHETAILFGPTLFFVLPSVANWMSFTGIMNALPNMVMLMGVAIFLTQIQSHARCSRAVC